MINNLTQRFMTHTESRITVFLIIIFFISANIISLGQVVYTPLENSVYDFIGRLSIKKIISIDDEVKPFHRKYIAEKLSLLDHKREYLNELEEKELDWYMAEYGNELNLTDDETRWFLFNHSDSLFSFSVSPIAGYGLSAIG
ncbi:MAG: hypothetical protein IPH11_00980 [Ignavibacteriales bacterium]|nr:hypothetical protein [Ignavibacteriales bacterium]